MCVTNRSTLRMAHFFYACQGQWERVRRSPPALLSHQLSQQSLAPTGDAHHDVPTWPSQKPCSHVVPSLRRRGRQPVRRATATDGIRRKPPGSVRRYAKARGGESATCRRPTKRLGAARPNVLSRVLAPSLQPSDALPSLPFCGDTPRRLLC